MTTDLEYIQNVVDDKIRSGVYTLLPAKVTDVSKLKKDQTINATPLIGRLYEDTTYLEPPEIFNIPVIFPSAGGGILSFPIQKGDGVLLLFSMRDLDNWEESNGTESLPPFSSRSHSITDAIAIAGLYTKNNNLSPNPTDVEIKFAGSSYKMKPNGDVEFNVAGNYIENISGNKISNVSGNLTESATDRSTTSDTFTHNGTNVGGTHRHPQEPDAAGNAQQDVGAPY